MAEKLASRSKTRRASPPDASSTSASDSSTTAADPSWHEAVICEEAGFVSQKSSAENSNSSSGVTNASELLSLHRRCFSCCNVVLQQTARLAEDHRRVMILVLTESAGALNPSSGTPLLAVDLLGKLSEQTKFTQSKRVKAIMTRVSERRYTDSKFFFDDLIKAVGALVAQADRQAVLDALSKHIINTSQADSKHSSKATFHGFPHPLMEEMMSHTALARKKLQLGGTGTTHVTVEVGRYLARAYGLGLAKGARFCRKPSQEKAFHAQRKKREIEYANNPGVKIIPAASMAQALAQSRSKNMEMPSEVPKKKPKLQPTVSHAAGTSKAISRSLRTTRRSSEDGRAGFRRADIPTGAPKRRAVRSRIKMRSRVDCHHLQGREIEMDDPEHSGHGFTGTLHGPMIACRCGCDSTLSGMHWLLHNNGRPNNRAPGYPFRYTRICETKENVGAHYDICDSNRQLCDTCNSWEAPGALITSCWECRTSVHATEECAVRVPLVRIEASAPDSQNTQRTGGTAALEMLNDTDEYIDLSSGAVAETESAVPENAALSSDERAHGESGSTKSPPILAWRGPSVGADGDGLHPLLTERPRPSYRKESGRGAPGGNGSGSGAVPNSSVEDELSVVCAAGSNNSGGGVYGGGGDNVGVGEGEKGAVSEEIFAWICQICSGGGSEESLGE